MKKSLYIYTEKSVTIQFDTKKKNVSFLHVVHKKKCSTSIEVNVTNINVTKVTQTTPEMSS